MQTIDQAATSLAQKHYLIEPSITQIFRLDVNGSADPARPRPVGLLEVNQDTIASGVVPLYFGPNVAAGIPFPSVIVEITPDESVFPHIGGGIFWNFSAGVVTRGSRSWGCGAA